MEFVVTNHLSHCIPVHQSTFKLSARRNLGVLPPKSRMNCESSKTKNCMHTCIHIHICKLLHIYTYAYKEMNKNQKRQQYQATINTDIWKKYAKPNMLPLDDARNLGKKVNIESRRQTEHICTIIQNIHAHTDK